MKRPDSRCSSVERCTWRQSSRAASAFFSSVSLARDCSAIARRDLLHHRRGVLRRLGDVLRVARLLARRRARSPPRARSRRAAELRMRSSSSPARARALRRPPRRPPCPRPSRARRCSTRPAPRRSAPRSPWCCRRCAAPASSRGSATTAKALPCSPAWAAMIAAFSESRLVSSLIAADHVHDLADLADALRQPLEHALRARASARGSSSMPSIVAATAREPVVGALAHLLGQHRGLAHVLADLLDRAVHLHHRRGGLLGHALHGVGALGDLADAGADLVDRRRSRSRRISLQRARRCAPPRRSSSASRGSRRRPPRSTRDEALDLAVDAADRGVDVGQQRRRLLDAPPRSRCARRRPPASPRRRARGSPGAARSAR